MSDEAKFYLQTREFYLQARVSAPYFLLGRVLISRGRTGSSRKFGFKFPVSGSVPVLFSSMDQPEGGDIPICSRSVWSCIQSLSFECDVTEAHQYVQEYGSKNG